MLLLVRASTATKAAKAAAAPLSLALRSFHSSSMPLRAKTKLPFITLGDAEKPAVIVLQEWWGVNDEVKHQAKIVVDRGGYQAVVPDLYRGKTTLEVAEAQHLMTGLDFAKAVTEIDEIIATLRTNNPQRKIAIMGFCMGGALSLASAALCKNRLDAAIPFYGIPPAQLADLSLIKCPVQGHYGVLDNFVSSAQVDMLEASLKASGEHFDIYRYDGAGHAFMNELEWSHQARVKIGQPPKDQATIDKAWSRVFEFLKKNIGVMKP